MCLAHTYLVSVGIELGVDGPRGAQEGDRGVGGAAEGEEAGVDGRVHSLELTHNYFFFKKWKLFCSHLDPGGERAKGLRKDDLLARQGRGHGHLVAHLVKGVDLGDGGGRAVEHGVRKDGDLLENRVNIPYYALCVYFFCLKKVMQKFETHLESLRGGGLGRRRSSSGRGCVLLGLCRGGGRVRHGDGIDDCGARHSRGGRGGQEEDKGEELKTKKEGFKFGGEKNRLPIFDRSSYLHGCRFGSLYGFVGGSDQEGNDP